MKEIGLKIGPIAIPDTTVLRSGMRWIVADGHVCRAGEAIAFCNIGLRLNKARGNGALPFSDEHRDFQVVFAPRIGGRLRCAPLSSRGGFLDQHTSFYWQADYELGWIEPSDPGDLQNGDPGTLHVMMLAGRRMTELAEVRTGILTGWHDRTRAWWGEGVGPRGTLLAMATCEQFGIIRGESSGYLELFASLAGPAQVVVIQDEPVVPSARVLFEQMTRTSDERRAIAEDMARTLMTGPTVPTPADWLFAGALASALDRSPITDDTTILGREGLSPTGPAAAVLISLNAEWSDIGRHRRLGYAICCHDFRLAQAGPAVAHWVRTNFERVRRTLDDIRRDYVMLLGHLRATTGARLLVMNLNSSPAHEHIESYAAYARPLSGTLGSIRAKELNLMLHDLAREHDLDIVDTDAIIAQMGGRQHIPDGTHQSGPLQTEVRGEVIRILRDRKVAGFASR